MAFPGEKYPLDVGEQNCLISNMLASECLLLLIGVVGSMVASGVVSGDWFGSIVGFGWAHEIALSCMKLSVIDTIVAAIVVTVIALAVAHAIEFVASHTTSGRLSIIASRRGLNGEIPRIDSYAVFAGMCAAGFAEELLFRFVLVGGAGHTISTGIADGRGVAAAFMLGACGVQLGTRFLSATECSIHPTYKEKLFKAGDLATTVTGKRLGDRKSVV